jgi:hypothetical protein|tara:strand:+ start:1586 stop:1813 length:228 start_codon:yes stop_codon:yes gene_type:complete
MRKNRTKEEALCFLYKKMLNGKPFSKETVLHAFFQRLARFSNFYSKPVSLAVSASTMGIYLLPNGRCDMKCVPII